MNSLDPKWITGFADGEGCFAINIYSREDRKTPAVQFGFSIGLSERDFAIVKKIKKFFGIGFCSIRKNKEDRDAYYACNGPNAIREKIIPHFDKYMLQSEKRESYELWEKGLNIWKSNLSKKEKLLKLVEIRKKMNPKGRKKPTMWSKGKILSYFC
jgi:hypothetical protein